MHQTWPTQGTKHPAIWYAHSRRSPCLPWYRAPCQLWELFSANIESQGTLSLRYFTTLSQQMLTAIKHAADDQFCFQQDSTLAYHACNTVKLQESELSTSLLLIIAFSLTAHPWSLLIMRFKDSHSSRSISCKSTRLNKSSSEWLKSHEVGYSTLEWKTRFCFSVSQGSAQTLFTWGGTVNYCLIA